MNFLSKHQSAWRNTPVTPEYWSKSKTFSDRYAIFRYVLEFAKENDIPIPKGYETPEKIRVSLLHYFKTDFDKEDYKELLEDKFPYGLHRGGYIVAQLAVEFQIMICIYNAKREYWSIHNDYRIKTIGNKIVPMKSKTKATLFLEQVGESVCLHLVPKFDIKKPIFVKKEEIGEKQKVMNDKVLNPMTNRYIKKDSTLGRKILKDIESGEEVSKDKVLSEKKFKKLFKIFSKKR
jgi:hypothetical protein